MSHSAALEEEIHFPPPPRHSADQGYGRALKISVILHVLFLVSVLFKALVFPSQPKPYIPSLRVDMVALPDVLKKDLQNLPPPRAPRKSPKR